MKYAPLSAGGALVLLLLGVALSKPITPPDKAIPLDFTGIDTLEVVNRGDNTEIEISSSAPAQLSYDDVKTTKVTVVRQQNRMIIHSNLTGYHELELVVPVGVHTFVVQSATFESKLPLDSVLIRASKSVSWDASIRELQVEDSMPRRGCKCDCHFTVDIRDGDIARLQVIAPEGRVSLGEPDKIESADLELGAGGQVTLTGATKLENIHIRRSVLSDMSASANAEKSLQEAPRSARSCS